MSELLGTLERIETPRLRFRRIAQSDAETVFEIFSHPEVTRYWSSPPMVEMSEAEAFVQRKLVSYAGPGGFQVGVERKEDGELLGACSFFNQNLDCKRAEVGYVLGRKHWGKGYMSEAMTGLIETAFGPMELNRLEADIDPRNEASAKLLQRLGFREEGLLRERWIVAGEVSDTAFYGLLRKDWIQSHPE
jgi:[ribosomal protein S5]-alanine N-acetyltransferase